MTLNYRYDKSKNSPCRMCRWNHLCLWESKNSNGTVRKDHVVASRIPHYSLDVNLTWAVLGHLVPGKINDARSASAPQEDPALPSRYVKLLAVWRELERFDRVLVDEYCS